ncbi:MAG: hypothetical protein R3F62_27205 [Planctomycetota bacterium]
MRLRPDVNHVTFRDQLRDAGLVTYTARVDAEGRDANNVGGDLVRVRGRPGVLRAGRRRRRQAAPAAVLEGRRFRVRDTAPAPGGLAELAGATRHWSWATWAPSLEQRGAGEPGAGCSSTAAGSWR